MKIPQTGRKRALIIVDAQPGFIKDHNAYVAQNLIKLIGAVPYDLYVESVFDVKPGSLWDVQQNWTMPDDAKVETVPELAAVLAHKNPIKITKDTRSVFKGDKELDKILRQHGVEEVHFAGTATHDCVMASAFDAFDRGYPVYVLEECSGAISHPERHKMGLELLRYQNMTNNSCLAETVEINL